MTIPSLVAFAIPALILLVCATLEVAFRSTTRLDLRRWAHEAYADDAAVLAPGHALEVSFISVRLARQISLVCMAVAAAQGAAELFPAGGLAAMLLATIVLYLVVDKTLPVVAVSLLGPLRALSVGRPVIAVVRVLLRWPATFFFRLQRAHRARDEPEGQEEGNGGLEAFLDLAEEEGLMSTSDEALLRGVADFGETVVREVMTPRVDVVAIDHGARLSDLLHLVAEHKFSRIPVIAGDLDTIRGIVHIKDLVSALAEGDETAPLASITKPALFVPETKRIRDLMHEFQRRRAHMAIVVDEYGGTAGLVTLEDLLEEIVGEIQDEYEEEQETVVQQEDGAVIAAGKTEVEEIERLLDVEIPDEEFETVGGMAFVHLGYVPRPGEAFEFQGLHVEVLEADERRVQRVRITRR